MKILKRLLVIVAAWCVATDYSRTAERTIGPETESVDTDDYARIIYVRSAQDSSVENGSQEAPYRALDKAVRQATGASHDRRIAVFVAEGSYSVRSLQLRQFVDLYGGFASVDWTRDVNKQKTILNGEGNSAVVIGAENARIDGFVITGGKSDGWGGGILCSECSPTISNNWIILNRTIHDQSLVDASVLHQQGNGGGGICCIGASPLIRKNWIAQNMTDFGNGGGISCISQANPRIERNVFSANGTGADDPKTRSSNGGAIACSHLSSPVILDNVFLNNHAGGGGDGGAIYGEYSSHPSIEENIFVGNSADDDGAAAYFMSAARPLFRSNLFVGNGPGRGVIRLSKNGLGYFEGNKIIGNFTDGIYCRSASAVTTNNVICENIGCGIHARESVLTSRNDTICKQKEYGVEVDGGSARIVNDIVVANAAGQVRLDTSEQIWVRHCLLAGRTDKEPAGRAALETTAQTNLDRIIVFAAAPQFRDDSRSVEARVVQFDPDRLTTDVELVAALPNAQQFARQPVRVGKKWTVGRAADGRSATVWGDLRGELGSDDTVSCHFPQTYHLTLGSPGIDRGVLLGSPPTDIDNQPRPIYARTSDQVDIGADEYADSVD